MKGELNGKVVVITGASRGIGRELALEYARNGANVVAGYHKNKEAAESLLKELEELGTTAMIVGADVTDKDDVKRMYKDIKERFDRVDVLVNNAGISKEGLIMMMSEENWEDVIKTNLYGVFLCSKIFIKGMISEKQGKIINIASLRGQIGGEGLSNYSASKAGVIGLTKSLARELGAYGIAVNAVCPGHIETDLNKEDDKNSRQKCESRQSVLGGGHAMNDLVNFVVFLSSDKIKGVSGQVFNVDSRI